MFNLEFGGDWGYDGLVKIDSKVKTATDEVVLNTKHLEINEVQVSGKDGGSSIASMKDVSYDKTSERATIKLSKELPTGDAVLAIKFKGKMNNKMEGFYRAKYKPAVTPTTAPTDDKHHYMFSTQFEPCDARQAFPCFDEPNLKASFELELEIPDDLVAISNMPEKSTSKGSKSGLKKISFERTPAMSTYVGSFCNDFVID